MAKRKAPEHIPPPNSNQPNLDTISLRAEYYADRRWLFRFFWTFLAFAATILAILYGTTTSEIGTKIKEAMANTAMKQASDSAQAIITDLTRNFQLADSLAKLASSRLGFYVTTGSTDPDNTPWREYNKETVVLDVDVRKYGFSKTPVYLTTLLGQSSHFVTTGISSIYDPTASGFTVHVRSVIPTKDLLSDARKFKWHIQWVALAPNIDTR